MKSFLEFYSQIKEDAMDAANPAMQAPQTPTMQNVRPALAMAKRLPTKPPAEVATKQAAQAPAGEKDETITNNNEKILKELLGSNYESFVTALGDNIKAPQFLRFLRAGLKDGKDAGDDKVNLAEISPKCSDLIPTQNEIDLGGSLGFPLKGESTETLTGYLKGGTHCPGKGCPNIVVCGKHIIDGHHRWSQLYCMNPNAQIKAINLIHPELNEDPTKALKVVQMSIGAKLGYIPTVSVSGTNLIGINENTLRKYISANISENAIEAFSLLQKSTNSKQEGNFEFILNYLKRLDEFEKDGILYPDYDDGRGGSGVEYQRPQTNNPSDEKMKRQRDAGFDPNARWHGYKKERNTTRKDKDANRKDKDANRKDINTRAIIEFAHKHIWKNVQQMNDRNPPISGASKRDFMPQTDPPANGWDSALKSGEVNWKQECLVLSGLIIRD